MRLKLRDLLALSAVAYLLCVMVRTVYPGFYTDILPVYYRSVLPTNNGIPYRDYSLEYPAIPAIMIWISGHAANVQYYMLTMAFIMFFFVIAAVYFLYRTCEKFSIDKGRIVPFFIMAPSFLVMSFFNWDMPAVALVSAAIYFVLAERPRVSGLCLGLGFAAKAYPLLLLPAFLKEVGSWNDRMEMVLSAVVGGMIPNLPFVLVDVSAWLNSNLPPRQPVYVENSLWMVAGYFNLINQDWLVNAVVWSIIILAILYVTFSNKSLVFKAWVIVAVTILAFPSYPPHYDLWLLPMFVLNPAFTLIPFLVFDFLNASIILSWFTVDNPFQPWGPIWDISLVRIGVLLLLLVWAVRRSTGGEKWQQLPKLLFRGREKPCP